MELMGMSNADDEWAAMDDPAGAGGGQMQYPPVLTAGKSKLSLSMAAFEEMGEPDRVTIYEGANGRIGIAAGGDGDASRSVSSIPGGGGQIRYEHLRRLITDVGLGPTRYRLTHDPDAGLWVLDPEEPWEPGDGDE
jgi:hypothetical protein